MRFVDFLIIGAGPTGLGASNRLQELGIHNFLILESNSHAGGLSASFKDRAGFTWDAGGHILFSKYPYFNQLMDTLMGEELLEHKRRALIRVAEDWIDYPLQDNIAQLSDDLAQECLQGIIRARSDNRIAHNFKEWVQKTFGDGISRIFMNPYNRKVWAFPLHLMDYQWIKDRVSIPELEQLKQKTISDSKPNGWGPNNSFSYPRHGGIGEIFRRLSLRFGGRLLRNHKVTKVDTLQRVVTTLNGRQFAYGKLLNTSPLDKFVKDVIKPIQPGIVNAAKLLKHNSVAIFGIGLDMIINKKTSWMYFPESSCPFYRVTHLHNYSPHITPNSRRYSAFMTEISYSGQNPIDSNRLEESAVKGLIDAGLFPKEKERNIISRWRMSSEYGYPIPCLDRDRILAMIQPYLEDRNVYSRGRFGGWKYEVGNMDHSLMQGVEWVERMVLGKKECTYTGSKTVN
ncbi:MAG: NAD(P)-binding protein [Nitrospina sp.]|nr:NAD(P)-binding protein [Nitrospina sp.]